MKNTIVILLVILPNILLAQLSPTNYSLGEKRLTKISDSTPLSNSILDIVSDKITELYL